MTSPVPRRRRLNPTATTTSPAATPATIGHKASWPEATEITSGVETPVSAKSALSPALAETTAFRNGTLQGAYFILAARSLGLDCGPMSGFDNAGVDTEFFAPICKEVTATEVPITCSIRSNFLCNLGYGDPAKLYPPNPRLDFEEACRLL